MNIESLETFVVLAENGNFTKTAEEQYLVQSTVSKRISELEKFVGKELFLRDNKNVKLTKSGEAFLPYAKRILMLKKDGIIKARAVGIYEDRLALGMPDSIYKGVISHILKKYFTMFPNIAIKLKVNHSEEIIKLLNDGILDIGFVYTKSKSSKLEVIDFFEDEIILVTSPKNEIRSKTEISYSDLIHLPLDFVKEGFGYAFVTKSYVMEELESGELLHVKIKDSTPPLRKIYMIINKNKKDSIAIKSCLAMINEKIIAKYSDSIFNG